MGGGQERLLHVTVINRYSVQYIEEAVHYKAIDTHSIYATERAPANAGRAFRIIANSLL